LQIGVKVLLPKTDYFCSQKRKRGWGRRLPAKANFLKKKPFSTFKQGWWLFRLFDTKASESPSTAD
jgi:hypothetical protein